MFARRVRELIEERGFDVGELAQGADVPEIRLRAYLEGEESADIGDVEAIARVLGVEAASLLRSA